jgi:hypothetical protein
MTPHLQHYVVQVQLNDNKASVHSNRGCGLNGHLALTVSAAEYALHRINNVNFDPTTNPPVAPVHGTVTTAPQISQNIWIDAYKRQDNVDNIL